jgi:DNA repair protein RecO (recombination protein O)
MNIQKTAGIVLSSRTMGEADVLATILTENSGKRKFSFKGLKKSRKRPKSAGEPGTLLNLVYYHRDNREIFTVNEFTIEYQPAKIREEMGRIFTLYFLLEVTEKTIGFDDDSRNIFKLLDSGIRALVETGYLTHLSVFYILHLLRFLGIIPDFLYCKMCGDETFSEFILEVSDLSPVCGTCYHGSLDFLGVDTREFITVSLSTKYSDIVQSRFDGKEMSKLLFNLVLFIENYYHITLKSKEFLSMKNSKS